MNTRLQILPKIKAALILLLLGIIVIAFFWLYRSVEESGIDVEVNDRIDITPEQIQQIKDIGEWEFLSVSDEQLVDTTRRGIFSDDHLVRIYYGTMRLGISMKQLEPGWARMSDDSLLVTLPSIQLLDRDFIDEARTRSFHESGSWSANDREALFKRAYQRMLKHGLTRENINAAQQNGEVQFRQLLRSMGFEHVKIAWGK